MVKRLINGIAGILLQIQLVVHHMEIVIGVVLLGIGILLILNAVPIRGVWIGCIHLRHCFMAPQNYEAYYADRQD